MRTARSLVLATTALVALAGASIHPTAAAVIQLGFILDESGSIGSANFTTIKTGLANAINTLIPTDGRYEVSVVTFSSSATTVVDTVVIDSAATRTAVANAVSTTGYNGGSTDYAAAFNRMTNVFAGTDQSVTASYVNFATDGEPNSEAAAVTARNAMITAGVDNISIEGIGGSLNAAFLQNFICYPGPCDATVPYNFPAQGFYIAVANAQGYADAIGSKITTVINPNPVPEPMSLALLGLGLAGLGLARRRRA